MPYIVFIRALCPNKLDSVIYMDNTSLQMLFYS